MQRQGRRNEQVELAAWASYLGSPRREAAGSRRWAHVGGLAAIAALASYLAWRALFTLPHSGWSRVVAWCLVAFETLPMPGLVYKAITLWNIDALVPAAPSDGPKLRPGRRVTVLIPTYNEPRDVLLPTVAAACELPQAHDTWVLDDGDRPWVAEMCAALGARYVCRPVHDHAKAGNINHALALLEDEERAGIGGADIIGVLDCDHVPLPSFLDEPLGWFDDEKVALVQGPQSFYNRGAFDDDGYTGEQGLFFNVLMPSRHHADAGPFWCGSTALVRVEALREIGGVATETITEDLHTTLKLIRAGWTTVYHHQTLAVGLAPATPEQYLLQRRRWGMGAMQILVRERLWAAKRWMSWRNFHEYLLGTLWWLEGIATVTILAVPMLVLLSGARTSIAPPWEFTVAFVAMFSVRLWGVKRLLRGNIDWPTAFALRVMRVPVGMACLWWLVSRSSLEFAVTPKGGSDERSRGKAPTILYWLIALTMGVTGYAFAGVEHLVPWRTPERSTLASGLWLALAGLVLVLGVIRIRSPRFATSRRNSPRFALNAPVLVNGMPGRLADISVGGASVVLDRQLDPDLDEVALGLPGVDRPVMHEVVHHGQREGAVSLRVKDGDWEALRSMALWLFHTPRGAVAGLPDGVPVVAAVRLDAGRTELALVAPAAPARGEAVQAA